MVWKRVSGIMEFVGCLHKDRHGRVRLERSECLVTLVHV